MALQRLNLTRDQLASFLQDFEQIKQFERLFATVDTINTVTLDEINVSAGSAFAAANEALAQISALSSQTEFLALAPPDLGGTVTSVSVVSANGFAGTVASAATTPAITLTTTVTGVLKGDGTAISAAVKDVDYFAPSAPVTKTADFAVAVNENWVINNKTGSTCTVTLPAAASYSGRCITFQNYQDQTLVSASSNVVPRAGGAAGTAILDAVSGNWATLVSNGTNWVIMQAAAFNNLLF